MASVINTNIASLNAQRNLTTSQNALQVSLQRLSSGLRINSAKDDAAGMAISDRMTSQIRGLNQASRNANDGISVAQTAEGGLTEMTNIVQRMRELSIQSANASNTADDRNALNAEVGQLKAELSRIATTTQFNGQNILDGSFQNTTFQVGANANQTIGVSIGDSRAQSLGTNVVTTNNTSGGLVAASSNSLVTTTGSIPIGKIAAQAVGVNGIKAQTLSIFDASGNTLRGGTIKVAANEQVSSVIDKLNKIDGVKAFGSAAMTLGNWAAAGVGTITIDVQSGAAKATLVLDGVTGGSSQSAMFTAMQSAIANNSDLTAAGVVAGIDGVGNLTIRNNTGADLGFKLTASAGAPTLSLLGTDEAQTKVVAASGVQHNVSGQMQLYMANGYTTQSSVAGDVAGGGLFKGLASTNAVAVSNAVGIAGSISSTGASDNRVSTGGTTTNLLTGKALAAALNGYTGEILTIKDASGAQVAGGQITTLANEQVNATAQRLNNIAGVKASGSNDVTLSSWTTVGATTADLQFTVTSGGLATNLTLSGVNETASQASVFNALKNAVNGNAEMQKNGLTAVIDSSGNLALHNNTGADIKIALTALGTSTVVMKGSDNAGTATAASTTAATLISGGQLAVDLAKGYTLESNTAAATSLFDGGVNVAVATVQSDANAGTGVAAQTLTVQGKATVKLDIARDSSAAEIAAKVNGQSGTTGVTAEVVTKVKLSGNSGDGTVSFDIASGSGASVNISAMVTGEGSNADMTALAQAINARSGNTGISASLGDGKSSLTLTDSTGNNVSLTNFMHTGGVIANASNIKGSVGSMQVSGVTDQINATSGTFSTTSTDAVTLSYGGTQGGTARSTVVGGTVSFKSSDVFNVSSDVSGTVTKAGNSSLFSGTAGTAVSSGLASLSGVDVSTVEGANRAISSLDGALVQIASIRGQLGAVQNRFNSTINALTATSENLSAARSRILDTDFAAETANMTRAQILQQAGTAMLAQANSLPQSVLSLLK